MPRVNRINGITQHAEAPTAVSVPASSNQNPFLLAGVCSDIGSNSLASRRKTATLWSSRLAFGAFVIFGQGFDALIKCCPKRCGSLFVEIHPRDRFDVFDDLLPLGTRAVCRAKKPTLNRVLCIESTFLGLDPTPRTWVRNQWRF